MSEQLTLTPPPTAQSEPRLRIATDGSRPSTSYTAKDDVIGTQEVHLIDYIKVLYKRRWTAFTAFLLILGSVTVYTFTATPIYQAKTRLLIESEERNVVNFKQVVDEDQTKADYYQTQYNVLQSRALARRTLDELGLWDKRPFGGPTDAGFSLMRFVSQAPAAVIGLVRSSYGRAPKNSIPGADETTAQSKAIDTFLKQLTVAPIRNSRLVDIKYDLPDPGM